MSYETQEDIRREHWQAIMVAAAHLREFAPERPWQVKRRYLTHVDAIQRYAAMHLHDGPEPQKGGKTAPDPQND